MARIKSLLSRLIIVAALVALAGLAALGLLSPAGKPPEFGKRLCDPHLFNLWMSRCP